MGTPDDGTEADTGTETESETDMGTETETETDTGTETETETDPEANANHTTDSDDVDVDYHRLLGIGDAAFASLEPHLQQRNYEGLEYRHVPDYRRGVERGTVLIDGEVVRGFPKVPRTLVLETGIPTQFDEHEQVAVEEKLNGYNVRVARIHGEQLAFSRSGMVCPFTTRLLRRLVDLAALFEEYPKAMVCGEIIGPENPYTAHEYPDVDSIAFRAFDWRDRESGKPLPIRERRERYEAFGVPQTPLFEIVDVDDAAASVQELIHELDAEDREGVILQSLDGDTLLKYTTSASTNSDLAYAFSLPFDYGQAFMFRRLLREGYQTVEWDEDDEAARERAHELGESILCSMREAIQSVEDGDTLGERHTVRASDETIDVLFEHLRGQGLTIDIEDDFHEDGDRVVTFCKRTPSSNDTIRNYLDGHIVRE
ncbi:MJ0414 family protein [Natrialba magadii ATCC 43099]|uniref:ATP dependent DNA ligase n=1 Tax=Natrialba magadii (strain ATCC 43099 / DSM 3394 / CCM 3739 / CIP 104546 / IAM 13178 / JCM 8861 / NBRC 102185 / NCIMB 2190 / MS3) TaxID=547559 RepID=D3SRI1_NATMM|nr:RNA ligase [Natrialba magadii]ADD04686.1 MJ0414 family protein [Natrialba magadii ATCC 43099]ELY25342.1 ATP dependent DNA ligase [Natrialba magadii ATCC 43099]